MWAIHTCHHLIRQPDAQHLQDMLQRLQFCAANTFQKLCATFAGPGLGGDHMQSWTDYLLMPVKQTDKPAVCANRSQGFHPYGTSGQCGVYLVGVQHQIQRGSMGLATQQWDSWSADLSAQVAQASSLSDAMATLRSSEQCAARPSCTAKPFSLHKDASWQKGIANM